MRDTRTGIEFYLDGPNDDYYVEIPHSTSIANVRRLLVFLRSRGLLVIPEHEYPTEYLPGRVRVYLAPLAIAL